MKIMKANKIVPARVANWMIISLVVFGMFNTRYWKNEHRVIAWDVISYYAYLPATFIYHDVSLKFVENYQGEHKFIFWADTAPNGGRVIKTSMGLSFMYAPFFFAGHLLARLTGYDTGGYSIPYKFMLMMSALFWFSLGLYFLRKFLSRFFNSTVVIMTITSLVLGSNVFWYATYEATMSHIYSFSLFAAFIYLTICWYESPEFKYTLSLGLLAGLIVLIRPTNILILLFFVFYGIGSMHTIQERLIFFVQKYPHLIIMGLIVFLVWIPQFIYWKKVTGEWFYFSYGNERFFFGHPHILKGLFGYRKGWLLYAPVMSFALAGIPLLYKRMRGLFWPILLFAILNIYVILSWWSWWYGGSFGLRPCIDSYPVLALPLAVFIEWILHHSPARKIAFLVLFYTMVWVGAWHTVRYYYGSIHYDSMCRKTYWNYFFRLKADGPFYKMLEQPDYEKAKQGIDAIRPEEVN
jgi:hypothetical protein